MVRILFLSIITLVFVAGCSIEEPDVYDFKNFKLLSLQDRNVKATFDVSINNENSFGFRLKGGELVVTIDDFEAGTVRLDHKLKIKRKSDKSYNVPVNVDLNEGVLLKLMKLGFKENIKINFNGKVKGSVFGISKTIDVDENQTIRGSDLQGIQN
jgi:LEA14-like dessication related protein